MIDIDIGCWACWGFPAHGACFLLMVTHSKPIQINFALVLSDLLQSQNLPAASSSSVGGVSGGTSTCEASFGSRYHPSASSTVFVCGEFRSVAKREDPRRPGSAHNARQFS